MNKNSTDMIDEYFKFYDDSIKEYGEKCCLLYACGTFYEVYSVDNNTEKKGNADIVSKIINCEFTNKNKLKKYEIGYSTRTNPDFAGFIIEKKGKFIPLLLSSGYTVVEVGQLEDAKNKKGKLVKRGIIAVHSPALKSPDFEEVGDSESILVSILFEYIVKNANLNTQDILFYSICSVNNITNEINVYENNIKEPRINIHELTSVLSQYNMKELKIHYIGEPIDMLESYLEEKRWYNTRVEKVSKEYEYSKVSIQNEYFSEIYKHKNFGVQSPLEFMNLEGLSAICLMITFDFIGRHDTRYLLNLNLPNVIKDSDCLILGLNTLSQLNIIDKDNGVFDLINHTSTLIGKRYLRNILIKPFKDVSIIQERYNLTETLKKNDSILDIDKLLLLLIDFERYHRKMSLGCLHPNEFEKLIETYGYLAELLLIVNMDILPSKLILLNFDEYKKDYKKTFNLENLRKVTLNTSKENYINFFNKGIIPELDIISENIRRIQDSIENIRCEYDIIINDTKVQHIKLEYTDQDGYFLSCTKIRFEKLKKNKKEITNLRQKTTNNIVKFFIEDLNKLSLDLVNNKELLTRKVKLNYLLKTSYYSSTFSNVFFGLKLFVEILDVTNSNLKCSLKYNYCKPTVTNGESKLIFTDIRHPIIERISKTPYITNDLTLDSDNLGILLYGLNSCGKSSLLRAIGVNLILAQAGLYTACKSFEFAPFNTIISQVDLTDNLFTGKSSFINEIIGLKHILACSGESTLVLADETCKGTEVYSAEAIVSTIILELIKSKTKFFLTSHLHGIPKIKCINKVSTLKIKHLSINIQNNNIIFDRKLKDGSGSDLYGLEVCKSLFNNETFIDKAFEIRNEITKNENKKSMLSKKSNYNKQKIMSCCEVCQYKPDQKSIPLDTHHINEQKYSNKHGFFKNLSFHKNQDFNLVTLCKDCHRKIDTKELIISGYKNSINGIFLDFVLTS